MFSLAPHDEQGLLICRSSSVRKALQLILLTIRHAVDSSKEPFPRYVPFCTHSLNTR